MQRWRSSSSFLSLVVGLLVGATGLSCTDPALDNQIDALGPEPPAPGPGANHRPGTPCVLCHSDYGTAPDSAFSVAGTVYTSRSQALPEADVEILMISADNSSPPTPVRTNIAGNFWVTKKEWNPSFPIKVTIQKGADKRVMLSHIGREPSCAGCHFDPPNLGPQKVHYKAFQGAGHVYLKSE